MVEVLFFNFDVFFELLECIDVINFGGENGIGFEVMKGFWEGCLDYREVMVFDDIFFEILSVEFVFVC